MLRKLMGAFTALILVGVLITGLLSMEIAKTYYYNSLEAKLISDTKLIRKELSEHVRGGNKPDYEKLCAEYSQIIGERITVIGLDGEVLGDSELEAEDMENHIDRPEVQQALAEGFGKSTRKSNSLGTNLLYVALPFTNDKDIIGILRISIPLNNINDIKKRIWGYIFLAIIAGIFVAVILGYRYLYSITRPIKEITEVAGTIAGGRLDSRVQINTDDEIGKLGRTFNFMSEKLSDTIEELRDDKSKIEAILTSSVNGVIAVDNNVKIMIINPVAEKLLDIQEKDMVGKDLFKLAKNKEVALAVREVIDSKKDGPTEFNFSWPEDKVTRFFSAPIIPKEKHGRTIGTLIIAQDITDIRKLEKIRSDFVANVTHELRTPLTSIRGFIETLKEGAIEDTVRRKRFLEIIDIESERLQRLIEDILLLSEIENRPFSLPVDQIDVKETIKEDILSIFNKQAEDKNIILKTYFQDNLPVLHMNTDRFKQMMINLIDNAIKYTPQGGNVLVSAYSNEDVMVLKIKDTGIGIPKEYQERLFERFYRVDKSRSRKLGGTGLGLAIVKHIVLSVEGTIKVSSQPEVGTEFKIEIPLKKGRYY